MTKQVHRWVKHLKLKGSVLDVGSLDVNGCVRDLFTGQEYTGVDKQPGPNVDLVMDAHDLYFSDNSFDNVISLEMLEHDLHFWKSLAEMYRVLKPGGVMAITARGNGFHYHNPPDYYRFTEEAMQALFEGMALWPVRTWTEKGGKGVFADGVKHG